MCTQLLEDTGVALLPGVSFGRDPEELSARLAYVDFNGSKALAAETKLDERFLTEYCPRVLEAIDKIQNWVSDK